MLAGAYFGIDLSQSSNQGESPQTTVTASAKPSAKPSAKQQAKEGQCPVDTLPDQVEPVIEGILAGKKPKYPENDGVRFGNYEGRLPKQDRNYYREYTVDTPGLNHRGERRIITGGGTKQDPDVWYYTDNHYESFCEIPDAE